MSRLGQPFRSLFSTEPKYASTNEIVDIEKGTVQKVHRGPLRLALEVLLTGGISVLVAVLVTTFLISGFYVPSGSMEPTLKIGDRVFVWKPAAALGQYQRGDIIVFKDTNHWLTEPNAYLVKRIIGLPGDKVKCCDVDGGMTINGKSVSESYLSDDTVSSLTPFSVTVPKGKVWVMGDNRPESADSRYHPKDPFISESSIVGVAFVKFWPNFVWFPSGQDQLTLYDK